jgi:hypothetical protein
VKGTRLRMRSRWWALRRKVRLGGSFFYFLCLLFGLQ